MNSLFLKGNLSGTSECPLLEEVSIPLLLTNSCISFSSLHNKAAPIFLLMILQFELGSAGRLFFWSSLGSLEWLQQPGCSTGGMSDC